MAKAAKKQERVVIIAKTPGTNWARILWGALVSSVPDAAGTATVVLEDARQAIYYGAATGGENGLAAHGPQDGGAQKARISAAVPKLTAFGVTTLLHCTDAANAAWSAAPAWKGQ